MAMNSFPWDSTNGNRKYPAKSFRDPWRAFFGNGVFPYDASYYQVVATTGMKLTIKKGEAFVDGIYCNMDANIDITLALGDPLNPRRDRIVLRIDNTTKGATIEVLQGTPASSPVASNYTRNTSRWELVLADVYVAKGCTAIIQSNITDRRPNSVYCGYVSAMQQLKLDDMYAQHEDLWNRKVDDMDAYYASMKGRLDGDTGTKLTKEITDASEGQATLLANLQTYVKKVDSGLGTTAPVYSAHTKTGMFSKTTNNVKYNVLNIYDGAMATQIGVDKTNNKAIYQSTVSPYPMVNLLSEKDNLVTTVDLKSETTEGCTERVINLANGLQEVIGWFDVTAAYGNTYGGRHYELPAEQQKFTKCLNLQVTPLAQCLFAAKYEVVNGVKKIAATYSGASTESIRFTFRMLVEV